MSEGLEFVMGLEAQGAPASGAATKVRGSRRTARQPDNLFRRGEVWWIRYNIDGKKIRTSLHTTNEREAKRLRDQILGKRGSVAAKFGLEEQAAPCKTFVQVANLWLESRKADGSLAPSTRNLSALATKNYFIPALGSMLMSTITDEDIERLIARMRNKGLARTTVAAYFQQLNTLFRQAIRRKWYTGPNPLDLLERRPTSGRGRDVVLTNEQAQRLLDVLEKVLRARMAKHKRARVTGMRLYYKAAVALNTGLRWGEVHGLAWDDLSLDASPPVLRPRRSFQGSLKNDSSAEPIPLAAEVVALLRRWRVEQGGNSPWVFPSARGKLMKKWPHKAVKLIKEAAVEAGLRDKITPHVFRHTFGTWVYEHTSDVKRTQRLLRHASVNSTMRYVHDRRELASVVEALPRLTRRRHLEAI